MTTDNQINKILRDLSAIAKAPMTPSQREQRAHALVGGDVGVEAVAEATARADLAWSAESAEVHDLDVPTWLEAVRVVDLAASVSLATLLSRLHAAEAAADLMRSGYRPSRDPSGGLRWSRP